MWLPTKLYERIPHFLLAVGVIFIILSAYLSSAYSRFPLYFGTGLICVFWGVGVLVIRSRSRHRGKPQSPEQED